MFDPEVKYANRPGFFTLRLHHGGDFTDEDDFDYSGGQVDHIDKVDSDFLSVIMLNDMLVELGYSEEDVVVYHFRVPGEDLMLGLRPLGSNTDFIRLLEYVKTRCLIFIFNILRKNLNRM
ncbi:hypothetical protein Hanom_Chr10g00952411 [Helianthus anomalus]